MATIEKAVDINYPDYIGETLRSCTAMHPEWYHDNISVDVSLLTVGQGQLYDPDDTYTTAYSKRINYFLKNMTTGQILTQGTLYYSIPTGYTRTSTAYGTPIPINSDSQLFALFLESPTGLGCATGYMSITQ